MKAISSSKLHCPSVSFKHTLDLTHQYSHLLIKGLKAPWSQVLILGPKLVISFQFVNKDQGSSIAFLKPR